MSLYKDKRTGKWGIQYATGHRFLPDKNEPGKLTRRIKDKSEVIGRYKAAAEKVLRQREKERVSKRSEAERG